MNYLEYVEKYRKILEPLDELLPMLPFLSILGSIADDVPDKELGEDLTRIVEKYKDKIKKTEIKDASEVETDA